MCIVHGALFVDNLRNYENGSSNNHLLAKCVHTTPSVIGFGLNLTH